MKRFLMVIAAMAAFSITTQPVLADDSHHPKAEAQKSYAVKGEVVVVDKTAGKVKLKHEAVPELDWPAMTMFFPVADKAQLDTLEVGDQVNFEFVKNSNGPLITQIKAAK